MDLQTMFEIVAQRSDNWETGDSNSNSSLDIDFMTRHPTLSYSYLVVLGIFTVTGNIANLLVIGSIIVYKPLRTTGNMFIFNLAIADMCITAIVDPFSFVGVMNGPRFFMNEAILCHVVASLCTVSCTCSMWTIAAVAVNRILINDDDEEEGDESGEDDKTEEESDSDDELGDDDIDLIQENLGVKIERKICVFVQTSSLRFNLFLEEDHSPLPCSMGHQCRDRYTKCSGLGCTHLRSENNGVQLGSTCQHVLHIPPVRLVNIISSRPRVCVLH
ncbi:hypothetical protein ScPMuIL_018974 [Solemya velum]